MTDKNIEEIKIKNGAFTLYGQPISAKIEKISIVDYDISLISELEEKIISLQKDIDSIKTTETKSIVKGQLSKAIDEKKTLTTKFYQQFPHSANAYVVGTPLILYDNNTDWSGPHFSYKHYPIIYLKIEEELKYS